MAERELEERPLAGDGDVTVTVLEDHPGEEELRMRERAAHPKCMPCYGVRLLSSPMVLVVAGLISLNWVAYIVLNTRQDSLTRVCQVILVVLMTLTFASYLQTVFVDAGTVPSWWHAHAARSPGAYPVCRRSNQYKPHRSHFDSVTGRLVLNMDHFCPWVANTVGFYNRKFFILFVCYACLACSFAALTILLFFRDQAFPARCPRRNPKCHPSHPIMLVALLFDGIFGALLVCFAGFHVQMALTNETTIEAGNQYDVGVLRNWTQVFGASPIFWFLPVWGYGPDGDGLSWPVRE